MGFSKQDLLKESSDEDAFGDFGDAESDGASATYDFPGDGVVDLNEFREALHDVQ